MECWHVKRGAADPKGQQQSKKSALGEKSLDGGTSSTTAETRREARRALNVRDGIRGKSTVYRERETERELRNLLGGLLTHPASTVVVSLLRLITDPSKPDTRGGGRTRKTDVAIDGPKAPNNSVTAGPESTEYGVRR